MKGRHAVLYWVLGLGLVGVVALGVTMSLGKIEYDKLVEACKQIKIGATEDHVRQTLGAPINTVPFDDGKRKSKILIFPSSALASTPPQIEIDLETHQVVEVICDDEYRLARPK